MFTEQHRLSEELFDQLSIFLSEIYSLPHTIEINFPSKLFLGLASVVDSDSSLGYITFFVSSTELGKELVSLVNSDEIFMSA